MIPAGSRDLVLNLLHHADHPGIKETTRRAARQYYWPKMRQNTADFVRSCHPCQIAKQSRTINPGVGDFEVPDKRFSFIHLDIVGPLPKSEGYSYLLTCYDRCSRWMEAYPLVRDSSEEVCRGFMEWVSRYGLPCVAFSDNGNAFVANLFQDVLKNFGVEVKFSPVYHAATNGAIERKHQDIKNALKASLVEMGDKHREQWFKALPWVMLGKRVSFQPHLDASAAQMVLGMSPRIPGELLGHPGPPLNSSQLRALLEQLYRLADRPPVQTSGNKSKIDIEEQVRNATHVYVKVDKPASLCPKFEGPYPIVSRPSRSQVLVKVGVTKDGVPRTLLFHWSSCKVANMRQDQPEARRPMLGRKPRSVSTDAPDATEAQIEPDGSSPATGFETTPLQDAAVNNSNVAPNSDSQQIIQTSPRRFPTRSTRNSNPAYVFT